MRQWDMQVFVFPLGQILLYPHFSKPFHIYEPKYIQMVEDSIRLGVPIAVASVFETQPVQEFRFGEPLDFAHRVVGYGHPLIVERMENGSMVIFLEGKGKAKLGATVLTDAPYIICEAEPLTENMQISTQMQGTLMMAQKVMVQWMYQHIADANSRDQFLRYVQTPEQVIGCFASYLVRDPDLQQVILESDDINEKIGIISRLIQSGELVA